MTRLWDGWLRNCGLIAGRGRRFISSPKLKGGGFACVRAFVRACGCMCVRVRACLCVCAHARV